MLLAINYTKIFTSIELLEYKQDRNGGRLDTGTPVQNVVEKDVGTSDGQAALGEDQMASEELQNQEDHHVHHQDENPDRKTLLQNCIAAISGLVFKHHSL